MINVNKELGYYTVGEKEFGSKIEACVYASNTNQEVKWIFNDDVFGRVNWAIEPEESLRTLYNQRARQIREKYDYVVISYSAGADSHNVLMSFVNQGLHVDEILVNTFEKANKTIINNPTVTDNWNYGAEYALQIYPRLQELKQMLPRTKITVSDLSDFAFEKLRSFKDPTWVLDQKEVVNLSGMTRYNYLHFKDIRKQFDKNYKIAMVVGVEKPTTYIKDDNFHVAFFDRSSNITPVQIHFQEYTNTTVENFYWHPSCTKLIAKQVHTIRKWLEANPQFKPLWTYITRKQFGQNGATIHKLLRSIIYPDTWNPSWWQADKSTRFFHDEIDAWFHVLYSDTPEHKIWTQGIDWIRDNTGKFMQDDGEALELFYKVYWAGKIS